MHKHLCLACLLAIAFIFPKTIKSQDSTGLGYTISFADKLLNSVSKKAGRFEVNLHRSTLKYLNKLSRKEVILKRKLARKDPAKAKEIFGNINGRYDSLKSNLIQKADALGNYYSGHLDSMNTALKFINSNNILKNAQSATKLRSTLDQYSNVQYNLDKAKFLQNKIKERQEYLKDKLSNLGLLKDFKKYNEKVYYYRSQVEEYKNIFNHPKKVEATLINAANKIPAFRAFFNKYSQLASLFRLPGSDNVSLADIPGLQTRAMVMQNLDDRLGTGPNVNQMMSASIQSAQNGLDKARKKINELGQEGTDPDMPDFKPNDQKTKSFLRRLELGSNIQSVKSNSFFPVTSDIGLSLGYKLSSKAVAGIGASYKLGWGRDFRHMIITHEGVGMRTFLDVKIKSSFWFSGGSEMNYRSRINEFEQLKNQNDWQTSVLAGISKKYSISNKFKGSVHILYDFLHKENLPATQPLIFRFGYHLK